MSVSPYSDAVAGTEEALATIRGQLRDHRAERDRLNAEIRDMVAAEAALVRAVNVYRKAAGSPLEPRRPPGGGAS